MADHRPQRLKRTAVCFSCRIGARPDLRKGSHLAPRLSVFVLLEVQAVAMAIRRALFWGCTSCALLLCASEAMAQATTVQLPTFSFFSVATTVSVPDRGSALLGGVNRASEGRSDLGVPCLSGLPFLGRGFHSAGIGRQVGAGAMRLSVQVHDFEGMERSLLGHSTAGAVPAPGQAVVPVGGPLAAIMGNNAGISGPNAHRRTDGQVASDVVSSAARPAASVGQARAIRQAEMAAVAEEAQRLFQRALKAESEGNSRLAKLYYEMAARRASGPLQQEISARLAALAARHSATIAQRGGGAGQ